MNHQTPRTDDTPHPAATDGGLVSAWRALAVVYQQWGAADDLSGIAVALGANSEQVQAVQLANHSLGRGWQVTLHPHDFPIFHPSWSSTLGSAPGRALHTRLSRLQGGPHRRAADAYLRFLHLGGRLELCDLTAALLTRLLERGAPVIAGVCASYLGWAPHTGRESRFVVLTGLCSEGHEVSLVNPLDPNHRAMPVRMARLIGALFIASASHAGGLVVIHPSSG